jgi:hypothetical protein
MVKEIERRETMKNFFMSSESFPKIRDFDLQGKGARKRFNTENTEGMELHRGDGNSLRSRNRELRRFLTQRARSYTEVFLPRRD